MKYTTALIALATAVSAQDISLFPSCSLQCIIKGIGSATSCNPPTDFECVCKNIDAVKEAALPCVVEACGEDVAQNEVLPATKEFCSVFPDDGGDDETPAPTTSEDAPAPTTTAAEEEPAPTTVATTTVVVQPTETPGEGDDDEEEEEPTGSVTAPGSSIPNPTGTGTIPATSAPVETAGAARVVGGLGMVLLGAVAAL